MDDGTPHVPDVSVVVPVYRNRETLAALHRRLQDVLLRERLVYEIVFVNDACPSGSLAELKRLAGSDANVRIVALAENAGQHRAVLAGLAHASGRCAVIMDADLQDPPEAIPLMLAGLEGGPAAVFAGRRGRYESAGRLLTSRVFKSLLHVLTGVPADAGMYVAVSRAMIRRLVTRQEKHPFVVAMIGASGLPVSSVPVARAARPSGRSSYSSSMRLGAAWSAIRIALVASWGRFSRESRIDVRS